MAYSVVTPAASEPITLTEAKNFLRVDGSDDDALITALIFRCKGDVLAVYS